MKIQGEAELKKKLKLVGKEADPAIGAILLKSGLIIERDARKNAPVRKPNPYVQGGTLRGSYNTIKVGKVVRVGTAVEYAPFVEYGTVRSTAQPHLEPAYKEELPKLVKKLNDKLDTLLKK